MAGLRPDHETFQRDGWTLVVVDWAQLLAAAAEHPIELLRGVPQARLSLASGDQDGRYCYLLTATVRTGRGRPGTSPFTVLGSDPIGAILSGRAEAGDPMAQKVVNGLETAVREVSRRLGRPAPARTLAPSWTPGRLLTSNIVIDDATGLRTTVNHHALPGAGPEAEGRIVTLEATVVAAVMAPAHVVGFFAAVCDVLGVSEGVYEIGAGAGSHTADERVTLDQVGGLDDVVATFREVATSFQHPQAMARWGARRPQGILLYGPPGTGKTMLARALANEIGGTLREIRTPEILDKWLGASERNMKRIFQEARRYDVPTVMLFDEFDSIISYAGAGVDSGSHAVNAVAGIFKQEMNNLVAENPNVIVVATTNFPHLINDSLVRSGRFDIKLEIRKPDAAGRAQILSRMIRSLIAEHEVGGFRMFADDVDLDDLAALSEGMTGADLREALRRAQMVKAMQEARGTPPEPISHADLRTTLRDLHL